MNIWQIVAAAIIAALPYAATAQTSPGTSPLSVPKGGTGRTSVTANCVLYGASVSPLLCAPSTNNGVLTFNGSGVPTASTMLPNAVQDNITRLGTVTSGVWNGTAIVTAYFGDAQVTDAKISNRSALSVFGRSANSSGVGADIAAGTDGHVLRRSGTSLGFGTLAAGAFATGPGIVTPSMLDNGAALTLLGRSVNSSGARADIAASAASGCVFRESSSTIGCGTIATAGIADAQVTDAKISNRTALSVFGRSANSGGVGADIAAANDAEVLRRAGTSIGFGTVATGGIADTAVTNAKLANMAQSTIKGRAAGAGTGAPVDLSAAQATAILDAMVGDTGSGGTKGLAPSPAAGDAAAGRFLKADGTWAVPAGGGGGGMTDAERQNAALNLIYQSKLFGGYRRVINQFADGYKASDGINSGSSANYSGDTTNGRVIPTVSSSAITINSSTGSASFGGTFTLIDRTTAVTNSVVVSSIGVYSTSAGTITVKIVRRNSAGNYDIVVSESMSHPGGGWSDKTLSSSYSVPGTGTYYLAAANVSNAATDATGTVSRAHRAGDITGTGQSGFTEDASGIGVLPMRYAHSVTVNNMTLVTTSQPADSSVSSARVLIEFNPVSATTLNTDITAEVTCNGGTNWSSATLSSSGAGQAGRTVAETADTACTSGTSFAARIKSLNNKNLQIYGTSITVH